MDCCGKDSGCGCQGSSCGCGDNKCECSPPSEEQMFDMFVGTAEMAWMKVLKEKMMKYYEKKYGKEMDKMVEFFCNAADKKWMSYEEYIKNKPEMMKKYMEEKEKEMKKMKK